MAKIYVSSTYLDLQEFREKILYHLHRLQQSVGAMEYYLADDRLPAAKCVADVKASDIYVGIYAWRYGTIPEIDNLDKLSITEMEYRAAREKGIPCLIFLHDGKSPWSPDLVDDDKTRIKAFRNQVGSEQTAQWFKTADELASLVGASLYEKLNALGYTSHTTGVTTFDLDKYYSALRKRYGVLALEGLTPPQKEEYLQIQLRQVFVEQSVRENPPPVELPKEVWEKLSRDKEIHPDDLPSGITLDDVRRAREAYYEKPSRPVLDVLTDPNYKHVVKKNRHTKSEEIEIESYAPKMIILGDPGSGKSTLARFVMLSLIDSTLTPVLSRLGEGILPLLIELRSYAGLCAEGNCTTFLEFLEFLGKTEGWHLTQAALHNHLKNDGRAVVIFDGLDEIFEPELRETITNRIVGFTTDYPKARVIVTSRVIGYRRKILTDAGFTHFTLQDLDEKQVETFVNRWYDLAMSDRPDEAKERCERILKSFKESASIRQLAGNPMLLTIMAIIGKHQELPRERWKLYDHAASVLIQHWDVNKHLKDVRIDADFIGEDDKKELLRRLAFRMQSGDGGLAGNYIHREHLQDEFENYLKERYAQTPDRAKVIAEAMIKQFRERNFILSLYGANLYGFVHRAFLEYFCASAFVWKFEKTKEFDVERLKTDVYGKHWEDQSWHEVLRLICGMVDETWVARIIVFLIDVVYAEGNAPDSSRQPFHAYSIGKAKREIAFPARCLSELKTLNGMERVIAKFIGSKWIARYDLVIVLETQFLVQPQTLSLLRERALKDDSDEVRLAAISAIIEHHRDDPETLPLLRERAMKDSSSKVRRIVVSTVAKHYRDDPETLPLLRERAMEDGGDEARLAAVSAIIEYYRDDPETLPLLHERAMKDGGDEVRLAAISAIIEHHRDDPETLPLLRERAIKDVGDEVRQAAVWALIDYYRDDPETFLLLRNYAINDKDWNVRQVIISALAKHFYSDVQTAVLLKNKGVKDTNKNVRRAAIVALAKYFSEDKQTLPLLHKCAIRDANNEVRLATLSAVFEFYRDDIQTLPFLRQCAKQDAVQLIRERAKELADEIEAKMKKEQSPSQNH